MAWISAQVDFIYETDLLSLHISAACFLIKKKNPEDILIMYSNTHIQKIFHSWETYTFIGLLFC